MAALRALSRHEGGRQKYGYGCKGQRLEGEQNHFFGSSVVGFQPLSHISKNPTTTMWLPCKLTWNLSRALENEAVSRFCGGGGVHIHLQEGTHVLGVDTKFGIAAYGLISADPNGLACSFHFSTGRRNKLWFFHPPWLKWLSPSQCKPSTRACFHMGHKRTL